MAKKTGQVIGGVDTHRDFHHAAVITKTGQMLGDERFPANAAGYRALLNWMARFGQITRVGIEGTGSYGAGLARYLAGHAVALVEVDRPDRKARRGQGKSDPLDAIAAARAALSGTASATPKTRNGPVEAIRVLRLARASAVKARTAAINQLKGVIVAAPEQLRTTLAALNTTAALVEHCARFRPAKPATMADPTNATKTALRALARRIQALHTEVAEADAQLRPLVTTTAPATSALNGVGPEVAGQLLTTAGDNPDRLRSEAAFAHLCGVAPIPASSGRKDRHRLNRGGDRAANTAIRTIVLSRMRWDPKTHAYVTKRTAQGLSTKDIIRCLKRYVIREVYRAIQQDLATT